MAFKTYEEKTKKIQEAKIQKLGKLPISGKDVQIGIFALEANKKDAIEITVDGKVKGIFYINEDGTTSYTDKG